MRMNQKPFDPKTKNEFRVFRFFVGVLLLMGLVGWIVYFRGCLASYQIGH